MKQSIAITLVFLLSSMAVLAQTTTENYIKTTQPQYATSSQFDPLFNNLKLETVVYYDGLGRPKQEIAVGIGPGNKNIIKHIEYELNIGQVKEYLPFVYNYNPDTGQNQSPISDANKMPYLSNAKRQTEAFYNSVKYEQTTNPYSESELEKSPLKRVLKQGSPGEDWKITTSGAQNVTYTYGFNTANYAKKFKAVASWNATLKSYDIRLVEEGYHAANTLYLTTTKDENSNRSNRLTNQENQVLVTVQVLEVAIGGPKFPMPSASEGVSTELDGKSLSEIMENGEEIGNNVVNNLSDGVNSSTVNITNPKDPSILVPYKGNHVFTYYVYDQYNNLTYVLPPLAGGKTDATTLDKLCYQYKYDHKNRLVAKKLPGKEWEYMVYDKADRLLAQGPVYSPFGDGTKGWMFSKYDALGRVAYTGYYAGTPSTETGRATFQTTVDAGVDYHEKSAATTTIDQVSVPYTNLVFPKTGLKILSINYYDDYAFAGAPSSFTAIEGQEVITKVKGLPTGSWMRVITTATEAQGTLSYMLYDYKERVLRSYKNNTLGGYTQVDAKYNFRGLATKTVTSHKYKNGVEPKVITQTFSYDKAERLLYQTHKIDNLDQVVVFQNVYDELGRLKQKRVGGKMGSNFRPIELQQNNLVLEGPILAAESPTRNTFLQEINYAYNIRGWLTQVNVPQDLEAGDFGKKALFAMKLNYNKLDSEGISGVKKLYNGNIAEQSWKTANDNVLRRYSYGYDAIDRLKTGVYQEPGGIAPVVGIYDEQLTYDSNGNILTLNRKGQGVANGIALDLDVLTYTYDGNILQKVVDASNNTDGFKQGSTAAKHYDYDTFGNLKVDRNKGVTAMKYNHLNLPTEVVFAGGKINYLYTATGEKIQKKVTQGNTTVVTDYLDGFQYVKGVLSFFPTAEGYFNAETNSYVYQYSDHLGNVRLSYSDTNKNDKIDVGEIIEENNYYPFGLAHKGYNEKNNAIAASYKYQYNGKEKQEELGFNVYDYGARNYDTAIGRWMNVDPLAEDFPGWNPYHYVHNNPINMTDLTGMSASPIFDDITGNYLGSDSKGFWEGEILFMDKNKYLEMYKQNNYKPINHDEAVANSGKVKDLSNTKADIKIFANVVDHISKVAYCEACKEDVTPFLLNGKISVYAEKVATSNFISSVGLSSDTRAQTNNITSNSKTGDRTDEIAFNYKYKDQYNTPGNIAITFIHESYYHGKLNIRGKSPQGYDNHGLIYPELVKNPLFKYTTGRIREFNLERANFFNKNKQ